MNDTIIGVDISKDWLDVYRSSDQATHRVANNKTGFQMLASWLKSTTVKQVVFEATGAYHQALETALHDFGLPYVKLNPRNARNFAKATGTLAKTDKVDAKLLAHFGMTIKPEQTPAKSKLLHSLNELVLARRALVKDRAAAKNRSHALSCALLKKQAHADLNRLKQIFRRLKLSVGLWFKRTRLCSIASTCFNLLLDWERLRSVSCWLKYRNWAR